MLALSWVAAFVALLGFGVGSVLQSVCAKSTAEATGLAGVARILRQLPYLVGLGLDGVGFLGNVVALQRLPLFLVQSILVGSVGVTAVIAALRGQRLGWRDWASLAALDEVLRSKPSAAKGRYLRKVTFTTTMGPGIPVDPNRTRGLLEDATV